MLDTIPFSVRLLNQIRRNALLKKIIRKFPEGLKRKIVDTVNENCVSQKTVTVPFYLDPSRSFVVPLDKYWSFYADELETYEPELAKFISILADKNSVFLDCGGNIGLWSVYASIVIGDPERVICIEPTNRLVDIIERNRTQTNLFFSLKRLAIWNVSGLELDFNVYQELSANSLIENMNSAGQLRVPVEILRVKTICLDDLWVELKSRHELISNVIVKLDVEGVEISALEGAAQLLREASVYFLYEDHGKELECRISKFIITNLGMDVYYFCEKTQNLKKLNELLEIKALKIDPSVGYNFLAVPKGTRF